MRLIQRARKEIVQRYNAIRNVGQKRFITPIVQAHLSNILMEIPNGDDLLFVTGFDKSGTTWLMSMLNSHPEIVCRGSGQFFNLHREDVPYLLKPGGYQQTIQNVRASNWWRASGHVWWSEEGLRSFVKRSIADSMRSFRKSSTQYVGDKSTVQDCLTIKRIFPNSKVIAIVRDGRDVAVSFAYHFLLRGQRSRFNPDGSLQKQYLADVARGWSVYADHLQDAFQVVHIVKYETLLVDAFIEMRTVFGELGVDTDAQLIKRIVEANSFERVSGGRRRGEEDPSSSLRKGVAGDWRKHFTIADNELFMEIAGKALGVWGY